MARAARLSAPGRGAARRGTIEIVTPAPPGSPAGNRVTALRLARLLRALGRRVRVSTHWTGAEADCLIVLHATRGAHAVRAARAERPDLPIVVVLTGTDVYGASARRRGAARRLAAPASAERADRIVGLQEHSIRVLTARLRAKSVAILQSYDGPRLARHAGRSSADFVVLGHLRPEKDPFRAALAARRLPEDSHVRVLHAGRALYDSMARRARREMRRSPRYRWLGLLPRARALALLADCRAMILSSRVEGGPSVLSEALALGVPVLAARIPSVEAILGPRHPGLFAVGDTRALAALMRRVETEPRFEARLAAASAQQAPRFEPGREQEAWRRLLAALARERAVKARPRSRAARRGRRGAAVRRSTSARAR